MDTVNVILGEEKKQLNDCEIEKKRLKNIILYTKILISKIRGEGYMIFDGKQIYADYDDKDDPQMVILGIYGNPGLEITIMGKEEIIPTLAELKEAIKILESKLD